MKSHCRWLCGYFVFNIWSALGYEKLVKRNSVFPTFDIFNVQISIYHFCRAASISMVYIMIYRGVQTGSPIGPAAHKIMEGFLAFFYLLNMYFAADSFVFSNFSIEWCQSSVYDSIDDSLLLLDVSEWFSQIFYCGLHMTILGYDNNALLPSCQRYLVSLGMHQYSFGVTFSLHYRLGNFFMASFHIIMISKAIITSFSLLERVLISLVLFLFCWFHHHCSSRNCSCWGCVSPRRVLGTKVKDFLSALVSVLSLTCFHIPPAVVCSCSMRLLSGFIAFQLPSYLP